MFLSNGNSMSIDWNILKLCLIFLFIYLRKKLWYSIIFPSLRKWMQQKHSDVWTMVIYAFYINSDSSVNFKQENNYCNVYWCMIVELMGTHLTAIWSRDDDVTANICKLFSDKMCNHQSSSRMIIIIIIFMWVGFFQWHQQ